MDWKVVIFIILVLFVAWAFMTQVGGGGRGGNSGGRGGGGRSGGRRR